MKLPLFGIKAWNAWDKAENKPGKRLGTSYSCLKLKNRGPVLVNVKVPGEPVVTDEAIRESFKAQTVIWADFTEYEEDSYSRSGVTFYTATATGVHLVDDVLDIS